MWYQVTKATKLSAALIASALTLLTSCQKEIKNPGSSTDPQSSARFENKVKGIGTVSPEMVLRWNEASTYVVRNTPQPPPITPFWESRYYAMVNIAMYDALNNIVPKYKWYALNAKDKDADPDAAVSQAAYDVIVYSFGKLNPPANATPLPVETYIHHLLAQSLNGIADGAAKTKGIALGHAAAQAILEKRTNDGTQNIAYTFPEGTGPGEYRWTPPFNIPGLPIYGTVDAVGWQHVTPFILTSGSQFRPGPPYGQSNVALAVQTQQYIADYKEIKHLGCAACPDRTPDQTHFAKFWAENPPLGWNTIARTIIAQKNLDAWKAARLLAQLHIAEADTYIASIDAKMHYYFWRPITAIQLNNLGASPGTTGDASWDITAFITPPAPDYPSAHAAAGGAAAEVIRRFFNKDDFSFSFTSSSAPPGFPAENSTRSFTSLSQAASENAISRMYLGIHFREACLKGKEQGHRIGEWVSTHALQEN